MYYFEILSRLFAALVVSSPLYKTARRIQHRHHPQGCHLCHQLGSEAPDPIHLTAYILWVPWRTTLNVYIHVLKVDCDSPKLHANLVQDDTTMITTHMTFGVLVAPHPPRRASLPSRCRIRRRTAHPCGPTRGSPTPASGQAHPDLVKPMLSSVAHPARTVLMQSI
ncbi:hypothetical protein A0H81_10653 [Grifola frondosa]|uniref:Uncharacterized protein n=1 Tax=Grifola frondosa TaxID=5627 RepID=A0A1C7LZ18_GRIFR|nr:hypothetical protein A0H81_10653 [Grifola frondosa]